jgi:fluoride exporter
MTPTARQAPGEFIRDERGASRKSGEAMERFLWVCLGSAVGGGARYVVSGWTLKVLGASFPYGTLAVNVLGSFLVAGLMFAGVEASAISPTTRLALTTGVMGGFTTYSTFSYETMKYLQDGAWGIAVANVLITVFGCLTACLLGWVGAKWLLGH